MKKYKDLIIVIIILVAVIGGTYLLSKSAENRNFREISYEKYQKISSKDNKIILYIGTMEDKDTFEIVKEFANDNDLEFKYIYADNLSEKEKESLNYSESTIIYSKGESKKTYSGKFDSNSIRDFFVGIEVIPRTYVTININDYLEIIKQEKVVVFIAKEGCGYCDKYKPVVNQVMADNDITIYHLDITKMTEEDYNAMVATASYFTEESWGTPTTLIFNKGEVVDVLGGYVEQSVLEEFLKTNGVL